MISRRGLLAGAAAAGSSFLLAGMVFAGGSDEEFGPFDQLVFPPIDAIDQPEPFGYKPATEEERKRVQEIIQKTPKGPQPIDVAQSFVDRFYASDPKVISQWPAPDSWNPLVVAFFNEGTTLHVSNDMVDWCAAFVNWCIKRAGKTGSNSAASQSFLDAAFKRAANPERGHLAIFTCVDKASGRSLGIGHVAFVASSPSKPGSIQLLGGNTSKDGHSSIICEKPFSTNPREVRRHVNGVYVPCIMKLSAYIEIQ